MQPLTLERLKNLREQAKTVQGEIQLKNNAQALWLHISEHDILNKKMGLSARKYRFEPEAQGCSRLYAETRFGFLKAKYLEFSCQWLPPHYFALERIFEQGWFEYLSVEKRLEDLKNGGCHLTLRINYVPRYSFIPLKKGVKDVLNQMLQAMAEVDANLPALHPLGFEAFFQKTPRIEQQIEQLHQAWADLMPNSAIPQKVAEFVHTAPDKHVRKLRPFEVADYFELPRLEVLTFCLLAAKQGFLDLSWDVLCPSCRGSNERLAHLWNLNTYVHCEGCNIEYGAHFDQNVEVTFAPRPEIRQLDTATYCLANPAVTRHVWAQITLDPHETRDITLHLPKGKYRLYSLSLPGEIAVTVLDNLTPQHSASEKYPDKSPSNDITPRFSAKVLNLDENFAAVNSWQVAEQTTLTLHNPSEQWITVKVERLNYPERIATAALVTSLQDFRDLFSSSEVLRPGMQLGLSNMVFLFSDLVGSTRLYERKGDGNAFALVQKHFDVMIPIIRQQQGGVVKTIGDAVMAVFTDSQTALKASLEILQAFAQRNKQFPPDEQIIIKLGLHKGPCIVLNLNDKLDYFGNTVNLAARIQGISQGNDVVMSETLFQEVQAQLAQYPPLHISKFVVELKGIKKQNTLYRVCFAEI
jgi:class 3 adenylate cyclase